MLIVFNVFSLVSVLLSFCFWKYINYPLFLDNPKLVKTTSETPVIQKDQSEMKVASGVEESVAAC